MVERLEAGLGLLELHRAARLLDGAVLQAAHLLVQRGVGPLRTGALDRGGAGRGRE